MSRELKTISVSEISSLLKGHPYKSIDRARNRIPECAGIYIWRYWPTLENVNPDRVIDKVREVQERFPSFHEVLNNSRQEIHSYRTPFGVPGSGRFLGVDEASPKFERFKKCLIYDETPRLEFIDLLDVLFAFSPPLYIGKADNLRNRISTHLDGQTDFSKDLERSEIDKSDVFVSIIKDDISSEDSNITDFIEEIIQRLSNPPFVKRYG